MIKECPHVYIVGNQPAFETTLVEGPLGQIVRLIAVPAFKDTGELLLLDTDTLDVEVIRFDLYDKHD